MNQTTWRARIERLWYGPSNKIIIFFRLLLLPFSLLFYFVVMLRYFFYRVGFKKMLYFPVPVIVVGNITTGGTGKTPFVIWLAQQLKQAGYSPGIVSRGVGRDKHHPWISPQWVTVDTAPSEVGDEAVLLAQRTQCPVVVAVDRVAAVRLLLQKAACNVVISDDGLQHYRLGRCVEIALVDSVRQFGNGLLLPAGPLREPRHRLRRVDWVMKKNQDFTLLGHSLVSLVDEKNKMEILAWQRLYGKKIHVLAGIAHPENFFAMLRAFDFDIISHVFPDHYLYTKQDVFFADNLPVLMTEKDAVKCKQFADQRHWCLPVTLQSTAVLETMLVNLRKKIDVSFS